MIRPVQTAMSILVPAAQGPAGDAGDCRSRSGGAGIRGVETGTIDAPAIQKAGAGFVLLVSLQRS